MTMIAARLDDIGKPAWIVLMIVGFFVWWPSASSCGGRSALLSWVI